MKVLVFEIGYTHYINDLSNLIANNLGIVNQVQLVSIFRSDKIYFPNARFVRLRPISSIGSVSETCLERVREVNNLARVNETHCESQDRILAGYYASIENILLDNKESIVIIYNDLRWVSSYVIDICKKHGIFYVVFERGVFRPHTTTMDFLGVNATSSVSKMKFSEWNCTKNNHFDLSKESTELSVKKFVYYFLSKSLERYCLRMKGTKLPKSSSKRLSNYIRLAFSRASKNSSTSLIGINYIFVPLQLSSDTQTLLNSQFESTQHFIDRVFSDYSAWDGRYLNKLVFKVHPLDTEKYHFPDDVIVSTNDTQELIRESKGVVTINSTVGFESCFTHKVVCCGDSFYTKHGFAYRANDSENVFDVIDKAIVAPVEYKKFILENYQVPGSISNYTKSDLEYAAYKIIKNYLRSKKCF